MTRKIHDELAKNYLEALLQPFGEVTTAVRIRSEAREIDVVFQPSNPPPNPVGLGLLSRMIETTAISYPVATQQLGMKSGIALSNPLKCDEKENGTSDGRGVRKLLE